MTFDQPETVLLPDGAALDLVAMRPADAERLVRFHHTLSSDTQYLRFFSFHPELSADELYRFTHVDHHDREAVVAVVAGEIVGVARFDRAEGGATRRLHSSSPTAGRAAVSARSSSSTSPAAPAASASTVSSHKRSIRTARMLAVFRHTGRPVTERREAEIVHLAIDLTPTGDGS